MEPVMPWLTEHYLQMLTNNNNEVLTSYTIYTGVLPVGNDSNKDETTAKTYPKFTLKKSNRIISWINIRVNMIQRFNAASVILKNKVVKSCI